MPVTLVDALFVISFVLPPAVVALGVALLAWPRRHARRTHVQAFQAPAN